MAGGDGIRFCPLSRQSKPKQLINLTGNGLMVNEAVERLPYIVDKEDIFIVTNESQVSSMLDATSGKLRADHILAEPAMRNTTACIGYAAMEIVKRYGDGIMITPSDHYIRDLASFTRVVNKAVQIVDRDDKLVTIGIKPTFPSSGFGYIQCDCSQKGAVRRVLSFREKPDIDKAKEYIEKGDCAWNSGMFVWKASTFLEKAKKYVSDIYESLEKIGASIGTEYEKEVIGAVYPDIRKISVDYAIMEPAAESGDVMVVLGEFGWNDVGSWDMLEVLHKQDEAGNVLVGDAMAIDTRDSILYSSGKLVAAVGIENIVVVETPDAIMVCRKDKAQDVKRIVDELRKKGRKDLL